MEILAILDHETHTLHIEKVSDKQLAKYNGSEQSYIEDNFDFEGDFSWDYITGIEYYDYSNEDPFEDASGSIPIDALPELID